ncbi:hypothetical protein DVK05_14465 [Halorubrum sp. Atlit-8R]|uniref:hypothetical protein n=1 Tax=unclassified Halorubrum TaxID=2642239 RepID=UPI000EF1C8DC|nr:MULTISPECIES: hypothetical protein [unclassified Halorubrum]RLM63479.1 hypothetical protein DVK08_16210 [Halorubrum sp. Atlit-9R]RLM76955.1 hypothetical protein DVK05_14465 [Halorubrum sp. Atlit-8R]
MSRASGPVSSKRAGENAEAAVLEAVDGLAYVPDTEHVDARAETLVVPSQSLPFVGICLLEVGSLVEIKSAIPRLASGRRGRFYLRREQHELLRDAGGSYLFAVCEPRPGREPVAMKVVPATVVDDAITAWRSGGNDRPECSQVAWSRIFHPNEVEP